MPYDDAFLADRDHVGVEETVVRKLFQILDPMMEEIDLELILILFPDEFTSLEEMSDDPYSSRFHYPIDLVEQSFYIFDMLQHEKAGRKIESLVFEGERAF